MSADNDANNLHDLKLLNKKRKKIKSKRNRHMHRILPKKEERNFVKKTIFGEKNIDASKQNIRHFFHFDWDDDLYEKESIKISKYITTSLYWYLIDSSYFAEDNIESNIKSITEKFLEIGSINNLQNGTNNSERNCINKNNNIINKIDKTIIDNYKNKINSDKGITIINYLNYDQKGKYFPNVLGHEAAKGNIGTIKEYFLYYINFINRINKERMKKIIQKSEEIQAKYNSKNINNKSKNNSKIIEDDDIELEENYLNPKNQESLNIRNKYWCYLYKKEKDFLIKRELKYQEKIKNDEEKEDNFYINGCNICNIEDMGQYNYCYECIQCGIKVHQLCYRIKTNPDPKKWKCSKCKMLSYKEVNNLECLLCPVKGGAMQRAKISKEGHFYKTIMRIRKKEENKNLINQETSKAYNFNNTSPDYPWVHLSCALWNKDIKIDLYDKKKNIKFDENNILAKYNSLCYICKLNNFGPTIKCKISSCNIFCHPECARANDYYFEMEITDKITRFCFYCQNHRPNRFIIYLNKISKIFNDEIFYFSDALSYVYQLHRQFKNKDFYPMNSEQYKKYNWRLDEDGDNNENIKIKKIKNKTKIKKNFKKRPKNLIYNLDKNVCINIKNNPKTDQVIINSNQENNEIKNVSHIKINNNETEKILSSTVENSNIITNNNQYNMNLTNETNSIKSNISHNCGDSIENNKLSTKCETHSVSIGDQKEDFALCLVRHLREYLDKNRIVCMKDDTIYTHPKEEDKEDFYSEELKNFTLDDLKNGKYNTDKLDFKGFDKSNKKFEDIYKNEEDFKGYFVKKIDNYLEENPKIEIKKIKIDFNFKKNKSRGRSCRRKK